MKSFTRLVVKENGEVWVDGVRKKNPAPFTHELPDPYKGLVTVRKGGVEIIERDTNQHSRAKEE